MKMLRLLRLLSKSFWREAFAAATLTVMVIFCSCVLIPVDQYFDQQAGIHQSLSQLDFERTLLFSPSMALEWADIALTGEQYYSQVHRDLEAVPGTRLLKNRILVAHIDQGEVITSIQMFLYAPEFGEILPQLPREDSEGILSVAISPAGAAAFPVGTELQCTIGGQILVTCRVAAVLPEGWTVPAAASASVSASLGCIGGREDSAYMIGLWQEDMPEILWPYPSFLLPEEGVDETAWRQAIEEAAAPWGQVNTLKEVEQMAFRRVLENSLGQQLHFYLLSIVALVSFGGYVYLTAELSQKRLAVLRICGLSFGKMAVLSLVQCSLPCVAALVLGTLLTPYVRSVLYPGAYGGVGWIGLGAGCVLLAVAVLLGLGSALISARRATALSSFREGE